MSQPTETTCWTIIEKARQGDVTGRDEFAQSYSGPVRAYLATRWGRSPLLQSIDDAVQEVFVECFREQGALHRLDRDRGGGFRPFLYGVVRNVARRFETDTQRRAHRVANLPVDPDHLELDEASLSMAFDRAWALTIMKAARQKQLERAQQLGEEAIRRVKLLELRFHENRPIREIAQLWDCDATRLHREYAKARAEFRDALTEVVAFHEPGNPAEVQRQCEQLLAALGS